jgi:hypothetical protein
MEGSESTTLNHGGAAGGVNTRRQGRIYFRIPAITSRTAVTTTPGSSM